MNTQYQEIVEGLLARAQTKLDGIAAHGSREPDVDAQVALADITLATALMQCEVTYRSQKDDLELA